MMQTQGEFYLKDAWPVIEEKLRAGGKVTINPGGISMKPLIFPGRDSVILESPPKHLKKYDVVLYTRTTGQFVLHRVIGEKDGAYIMCGDNQYSREHGIKHEAVLAIATSIIRNKKHIELKGFLYRVYSVVWVFLQRINEVLHKIKAFLGKLKRRIFRG